MTIRMRTMELPGNQYVLVVDRVPVEDQRSFARAFSAFATEMRELTDGRCVSGLVFHDPVELPGDPPDFPLDMFGPQPVKMEENVSVCEWCRSAADGTDIRLAKCATCGKSPVAVYRTDVPESEQSVYVHKNDATGARCEGSRQPPEFTSGHDLCNGCPCQHRERGAWRGRPTD
jgi:hypothetical protein